MTLTRWQPLSELRSLRTAMERLFEEGIREPARLLPRWSWATPIDMYETDTEVVIRASLPGVKPEDVDITAGVDTVTLRAEVKRDEAIKSERYVCQEIEYGQIVRTVPLPMAVRAGEAEAHFENGMLVLKLPKAEEAKIKHIPIKAR